MTVRGARRVGWGLYGGCVLVAGAATRAVWARASERGDWGGFALLWGPLALVAVVAGAVRFDARWKEGGRVDLDRAVSDARQFWTGILLGGTLFLNILVASAFGTGFVRLPLLALFGAMAIFGTTIREPDDYAPPEGPWARWFALRWRWGFYGVLAFGAAVAVRKGELSTALLVASSAKMTFPWTYRVVRSGPQ